MDEHNPSVSENTELPQASEPAAAEPSPFHELEKEIDLNTLFPEADRDLNALFPDEDMRHLLKSLQKNKKDLHRMRERFTEENDIEEVDVEEALEHLQNEAEETPDAL